MTTDPDSSLKRAWTSWLSGVSMLVVGILYFLFSYDFWSYYPLMDLLSVLLILSVLYCFSRLYKRLERKRKSFSIGKVSLPGVIAITNLILVAITIRLYYACFAGYTGSYIFNLVMLKRICSIAFYVLISPTASLVVYLGIDYDIIDLPYPFLFIFAPLNAYLFGYVFAVIVMLFRKRSDS